MVPLLIIGAGGHGRVIADAATAQGYWSRVVFLDSKYPRITSIDEWEVLGKIHQVKNLRGDFTDVVVGIGNNSCRSKLIKSIVELGFSLPIIRHPISYVSNRAYIGAGTVIFAQTAINIGVRLGSGCIVNTGATIDHDCQLGDSVHIAPGAHLGGGVSVGQGSWIGIGASVKELITIGNNVIVGGGAAVIRDIPDDVTVVGVPAREIS